MSLSKFLECSDVRARFRKEFPKPKFRGKPDLLASPQSHRYGLVGTAFDYLLRFHIQRLNPKVIYHRWIAEAAVSRLGLREATAVRYELDAEELFILSNDEIFDRARGIFRRAESNHKRYLKTGKITDALLCSVIGLAQLDTYFRSGHIGEDLGTAYREDIRDLRNMLTLARSIDFHTQHVCVLNPTFGEGSRLIQGADADLLIEGTLIEIKTTKKMELAREHFNQLIGYLAMSMIWGIDGLTRGARIKNLGIYFARYASMQVFDVDELTSKIGLQNFLAWFRDRVEQYRSGTLSSSVSNSPTGN